MRDLRLGLEDRPHQPRQLGVDVGDLLELVEHERDGAPALGRQLARQLEQALDRGVRGPRRARTTLKRNATLPVSGSTVIVGETRRSANTRRRSLARSSGVATSSWIARASFSASLAGVGVVIRSTLRHEHLLAHELVRRPPDERGLAVAARREDHDVLAVADVGLELGDLLLAVRERVVERERAEAERVDVSRHAVQRNAGLRNAGVRVIPSSTSPRPPRTRSRRSSGRRGRATSVVSFSGRNVSHITASSSVRVDARATSRPCPAAGRAGGRTGAA